MSQVIVFENENGGVSLCTPTQEALQVMTLFEIAKKDTPEGKDFWIIQSSLLPSDHTFFNAWELDKKALGKPHGTGSQRLV